METFDRDIINRDNCGISPITFLYAVTLVDLNMFNQLGISGMKPTCSCCVYDLNVFLNLFFMCFFKCYASMLIREIDL